MHANRAVSQVKSLPLLKPMRKSIIRDAGTVLPDREGKVQKSILS